MIKLWINRSVATLEAHKSEKKGVKTNCFNYKNNTIEVLSEWLLTTPSDATTRRISIFTLSLLEIRAVFLMFPNVCFLISQRWKKISTHNLHHCELYLKKKLRLEYEWNRKKLKYWKIVANEKCTAENCELSSVKNLFWANHASKKARNNFKRKIFGWKKVSEKKNWLYWVILENWGRNGQKTPKKA